MKREKILNNKGLTILELIIVIAVMAILISVVAPQLLKYIDRARKMKDMEAARVIGTTLERIIMTDPEAYQNWENINDKKNHVEYKIDNYLGESYVLTNVFEYAMTSKRKGALRDARGDCAYLAKALSDDLGMKNIILSYTKYSCGLLRIGKRLSDGRVEVWMCPVPKGTDGEGKTNGWLYWRLYPDPDPRFMGDGAPVGINAKGAAGTTF